MAARRKPSTHTKKQKEKARKSGEKWGKRGKYIGQKSNIPVVSAWECPTHHVWKVTCHLPPNKRLPDMNALFHDALTAPPEAVYQASRDSSPVSRISSETSVFTPGDSDVITVGSQQHDGDCIEGCAEGVIQEIHEYTTNVHLLNSVDESEEGLVPGLDRDMADMDLPNMMDEGDEPTFAASYDVADVSSLSLYHGDSSDPYDGGNIELSPSEQYLVDALGQLSPGKVTISGSLEAEQDKRRKSLAAAESLMLLKFKLGLAF